MIVYYGNQPLGHPFQSSDPHAPHGVFFVWNTDVQRGHWVSREGLRVAESRFHPGMSIVQERWMITHDPATDRDYDMDEGL